MPEGKAVAVGCQTPSPDRTLAVAGPMNKYPLVMTNKAMENGEARNSEFSQEKW